MITNYSKNKAKTVHEESENMSIKIGVSELMENQVDENPNSAPLNIKKAEKPDMKVPEDKFGYYQNGELIKFSIGNPDVEKAVLTINNNDIVDLCVDRYLVWLYMEDSDYMDSNYVRDVHNIRKTKYGYIYRQHIVYKDALRILKRLGYKKSDETIFLSKTNNKVTSFSISEEWYSEKHDIIYKYLSSIVDISQNN